MTKQSILGSKDIAYVDAMLRSYPKAEAIMRLNARMDRVGTTKTDRAAILAYAATK